MYTDTIRANVFDELRQRDLRPFADVLTDDVFECAALNAMAQLGKSALSLPNLVWLSLLAAWHTTKDFATLLTLSWQALDDANADAPRPPEPKAKAKRQRRSKHNPHGGNGTAVSEEAFTQARRHMPKLFWWWLFVVLGHRFEQRHAQALRWRRFRLLALDGTTLTLPQWQALADHYGRAKNGKSPGTVQARMVMLQFPTTRMPWRYEVTPLGEGERTVAGRLLGRWGTLFADDLVLMDKGFWSFGLFCQVARQGAYFAIRLHGQAKVHTLKRLGGQDRLVRWDKPTGPRWRDKYWPESLRLRVIGYHIKGFRPSAVVTNVLDPAEVSRQDWIRLATESPEAAQRLDVGIYHLRWQIETSFAELKVSQGMEGGLRSRKPRGIEYEIAGHVLLYLLLRWRMVEAASEAGLCPLELSFTKALESLKDLQATMRVVEQDRASSVLLPRLLQRLARQVVPFRPGRRFDRPKDKRKRAKKKAARQTKAAKKTTQKQGPVQAQTKQTK